MRASRNSAVLSESEVRWAIAQATRAPSIHNTQPWRFTAVGDVLTLRADTTRGLSAADPGGRELVISCGAALFNLRLALRKLAVDATVELLPEQRDPRVLARVTVVGGEPASPDERRLFTAIARRHTHRGAFANRPIKADLAVRLQQAAQLEGAALLYANDPGQRTRLLHLTRAAERLLSHDERVREEILLWTPGPDSPRLDGIPARAYGAAVATDTDVDDLAPRDFDLGRRIGELPDSDQPPGAIAVLASTRDVEVSWMETGQALERVLLTAADSGAYAALHSQAIEVPHVRGDLQRELATALVPQLMLRFGYAADALPTPRRLVDDVIDLPE